MFKLFLFGAPRCQQDGRPISLPRRKCLALLAYLAVNPRPHSRETLATLLYPDSANALAYLRRSLSELRQYLDHRLLLDGNEVQLAENELWVDVLEFENLTRAGDQKLENDGAPVADLQEAVALYTADFMSGFTLPDTPAYDEWQFLQGEGLRQNLAAILRKLIAWHSHRREFEQSVEYGRRWLALDPLHEPAHRELMQLYAATGQRAAALRQYDECRRLLQDELGIAPGEETRLLYEAIRSRQWPAETQFPPEPSHNFPTPTTSFVGRQKEIGEIGRALGDNPDCRLFTIVGQGGTGKTRLALEVGQRLLPAFTHGACLVSLAPVSQTDDLSLAIAADLNLSFSGRNTPRDQLLAYLERQHLLLILDNFEHLLAGVELLTDILSTAPNIKLLVTSRERLNLQLEWAYDLAGLTYPRQSAAAGSITELLHAYDAPALFVQRAQQARTAFELSTHNLSAILRICQLVEGMPLGLELAASWIPTLSCQEIAAGVARNLDFLTSALHDIPDRHRSLRAVFQHSWSLLKPDEQVVLSRLSIFRGGFIREAAEQVTGTTLLPLAGLVRKSLVTRERSGRYAIHELLRQFAAEKLGESPETVAITRKAHAAYFAAFLQQREDELWTDRQLEALDEIAVDLDNVRQGWQWAVERQDVALLNQAAIALFLYYDMRGHIQEGEHVFKLAVQSVLSRAISTSLERLCLGKLLMGRGWFAVWTISFVTSEEFLQQAANRLRSVGAPASSALSLTLNYLGLILCFRGKAESGREALQESLELARAARSRALVGRSLFNLGQTAVLQGEYQQAEILLEEALHELEMIGEQHRRSLVLNRLGEAALELGKYDKAESCFQESLSIRKRLGDQLRILAALQTLGVHVYRRGDYDRAEKMLQESLAMNQQIGNLYQIGEDYLVLGMIVLARGHLTRAEAYLQQSLAIFREMGIPNRQPEVLIGLARLELDRGRYRHVRPLLSEAMALANGNRNLFQEASTSQLWGELELHEADLQAAARHFDRSLATAARLAAAPLALATCLSTAGLFMPPHQDKLEQAVALIQAALAHPAADQPTRDRARALLETLPDEIVTSIVQTDVDLWAIVSQLRTDLKQLV